MKKIYIFLCIVILISFSACEKKNEQKNISPNSEYSQSSIPTDSTTDSNDTDYLSKPHNVTETIYDINNNKIGEITYYGNLTLFDNKILYNKMTDCYETFKPVSYEYCIYDIKSKRSVKLGEVKDWSYEAAYDTVQKNGHIYMLISTEPGKKLKYDNITVHLYDIDLDKNTMTELMTIKDGDPYSSMTVTDNKILIVNKTKQAQSILYEYNIKNGKIKTPLKFSLKEDKGDIISQISNDGKYLYLLRLNIGSKNKVNMFADTYSLDYKHIKSVNVSCFFDELNETVKKEDLINEFKTPVGYFNVRNNCVFFQNFSLSRYLGKFENNKINKIMPMPEYINGVKALSDNSKAKMFYDERGKADEGVNFIYILNTKDASIVKKEFYAPNKRYCIESASVNENDTLLLTMGGRDENNKFLTGKNYILKLSELK